MSIIPPPRKPFPDYKWIWASVQPTESLNSPPVLLGALRVFHRFDGLSPGSDEILNGLALVQEETGTDVNLVRTPERNLIRNSGQYWKALGLLDEAHGKLSVTAFGKLLATGTITQSEFAVTVVHTLELPNRYIFKSAEEWDNASLRIRPLQLILKVLSRLDSIAGERESYLTRDELVKVIIPLAGNKASVKTHTDAILQFREGLLDTSLWPDCAPKANDKRMAGEFLTFLANHGFCRVEELKGNNSNRRFYLDGVNAEDISELFQIKSKAGKEDALVRTVRESHIPENLDRRRVTREMLIRAHQQVFRNNVLAAFDSRCLVTGVSLEQTLEACHIRDVKHNGADRIENGLCLRTDIHRLFDSRHLRILPNGDIVLSEAAAAKNNYGSLPHCVEIPGFVNREHLEWREKYT